MKSYIIVPVLLFIVSMVIITMILTDETLYNRNLNISKSTGMLYKKNEILFSMLIILTHYLYCFIFRDQF